MSDDTKQPTAMDAINEAIAVFYEAADNKDACDAEVAAADTRLRAAIDAAVKEAYERGRKDESEGILYPLDLGDA